MSQLPTPDLAQKSVYASTQLCNCVIWKWVLRLITSCGGSCDSRVVQLCIAYAAEQSSAAHVYTDGMAECITGPA